MDLRRPGKRNGRKPREGAPSASKDYTLMRTSRAFYENLPPGKINYYKHVTQILYSPAGLEVPIPAASLTVPSDQVFDLTYVAWRCLIPSPDPTVYLATHDDYLALGTRFIMRYNRAALLDFRMEVGGVFLGEGVSRLNSNLFDADDNTTFHLILQETGKLEFAHNSVAPLVPVNTALEVEVRGIWIPKVVWNDIEEDLR